MAATLVGRKFSLLDLQAMLKINSVLTGLSRISRLDKSNIRFKVPLFTGERMQGNYDEETASDETSNPYGIGFYEGSILEHLHYKQLSIFRRFCRRICIKFQFSWYELILDVNSENRRYSGRLYRDDLNRSLQLQSFMVSELIRKGRYGIDKVGDCDLASFG